jgi:hypothetical protein
MLRRADPKSLSDEELALLCSSGPLEEMLLPLSFLVASIAALSACAALLGSASTTLAAGFMLAAGALFLALHSVSRPKRRYRKELVYRSGMAPFQDYVAEAEAGLAKENVDWTFLFTVRHLPHGDCRWLRIVFNEVTSSPAQLELRVSGRKPRYFRRTAAHLPDAPVQELIRAVKTLDLASLTSCPALVLDGVPCQLAILRREPRSVTVASCNLSGHHPAGHPAVRVCAMLHEIAQRTTTE